MNDAQVNLPWSYVTLLTLRDLQAWLTRVDWMMVFGAILILGTITIFWMLSRGRSKFNFADAFAGENGKTSMAKLAMWTGVLTTSWIMVAITLGGKMTEGLFTAYLFGLVLGKVGTEAIGVLRQAQVARTIEARGGADPDSAPEPAGSLNVNVPLSMQPGAATATLQDRPVIPQPRPTRSRRPLGKRDREEPT